MNKIQRLLLAIMFFAVVSEPVMAQTDDENAPKNERFAVGFQASFPAYGISGMANLTKAITAQVTVDPFGDLKNTSLRGLYKVEQDTYWALYGFGLVGAWGYKGLDKSGNSATENTLALGLGGGFEYDVRAFVPDLAPILWNVEAGYVYTWFDEVDADYSGFLIGVGIHYRF